MFGDLAVLSFVVVQCLDGMLTYIGISTWGPTAEANPLVRAAVGYFGLETGLYVAKLIATGFGIFLHLARVHVIVALLTALYITLSILPWTLVLFSR